MSRRYGAEWTDEVWTTVEYENDGSWTSQADFDTEQEAQEQADYLRWLNNPDEKGTLEDDAVAFVEEHIRALKAAVGGLVVPSSDDQLHELRVRLTRVGALRRGLLEMFERHWLFATRFMEHRERRNQVKEAKGE